MEDESVASRAVDVWKFVVSVINHYESLSKSKCPKNNKSYDLLVKHMTDYLMLVKFQFFKGIASVLSFYLTKFQTDAPTVSSLPGLLERNLRQVMKMFLRAAVVDEATLPYKLIKIDLEKKENFLSFNSVKLPTVTKSLLASSKASPTQKLRFKESLSTMLKNVVLKMQERSPLKYILIRSFSSLNPKNMVNNKADSIKMFTTVIDKLYDKKHHQRNQIMPSCSMKNLSTTLSVDIRKISLILTWPTIA